MKARETELAYIYLFFDLIILNLSIVFMAWYSLDISLRNYHDISIYLFHGNLAWIITYFIFSKKNLFLRDSFLNRIIRISKRTLFFLVCLSVLAFLLMPQWYSRNFLIEYTVLFYVGKLVFYYFLYTYLKRNRQNGKNINRVIIFGVNDTSRLLRRIIDSNYLLGYRFVGYVSNVSDEDPDIIGHSDNLDSLIDQHQVQMVFVAMSIFSEGTKEHEVLKICNQKGIRLRFIPENQRWYKSRLNMESVGGLVLINPQEIPLDDLGSRAAKRLFDILFSGFVILFVFTWSMPIIALLIKLSSKGPVFFAQKRTGINNQTFTCLKFRSMQVNDEADEKQATANDCRTTRIGQFLRKTNIDEFPQFFNVFMGQMSVVGPRPHMLKHTEEYSKLIKHYLIRHYVKPGVTGWAQVNGLRGETDELWKMEQRVKHDMEYIENWTFWWDIAIIWQTLFGADTYKNAG
jgi:Undecaprenyl-phosphate glucose phosphotransferase